MISPTANCQECGSKALVFWTREKFGVCESCFTKKYDILGRKSKFKIMFGPLFDPQTGWIPNNQISFGDLREYIDDCLRPNSPKHYTEHVISSTDGLLSLINQLEQMVYRFPSEEEKSVARATISMLEKDLAACQESIRAAVHNRAQVRVRRNKRYLIQEELGRANERLLEAKDKEITLLKLLNHARQLLEPTHEVRSFQLRAVERLRREFLLWKTGTLEFAPKTMVHRVYWKILNPSNNTWEELERHFQYLARVSQRKYDLKRLKYVYDFKPNEIYIGTAEFEGYVVFCFNTTGRAVLECPEVGNALYFMDTDQWKFLSMLSKTELLVHHSKQIRRVIHSEYWQSKVKAEMLRRRFV